MLYRPSYCTVFNTFVLFPISCSGSHRPQYFMKTAVINHTVDLCVSMLDVSSEDFMSDNGPSQWGKKKKRSRLSIDEDEPVIKRKMGRPPKSNHTQAMRTQNMRASKCKKCEVKLDRVDDDIFTVLERNGLKFYDPDDINESNERCSTPVLTTTASDVPLTTVNSYSTNFNRMHPRTGSETMILSNTCNEVIFNPYPPTNTNDRPVEAPKSYNGDAVIKQKTDEDEIVFVPFPSGSISLDTEDTPSIQTPVAKPGDSSITPSLEIDIAEPDESSMAPAIEMDRAKPDQSVMAQSMELDRAEPEDSVMAQSMEMERAEMGDSVMAPSVELDRAEPGDFTIAPAVEMDMARAGDSSMESSILGHQESVSEAVHATCEKSVVLDNASKEDNLVVENVALNDLSVETTAEVNCNNNNIEYEQTTLIIAPLDMSDNVQHEVCERSLDNVERPSPDMETTAALQDSRFDDCVLSSSQETLDLHNGSPEFESTVASLENDTSANEKPDGTVDTSKITIVDMQSTEKVVCTIYVDENNSGKKDTSDVQEELAEELGEYHGNKEAASTPELFENCPIPEIDENTSDAVPASDMSHENPTATTEHYNRNQRSASATRARNRNWNRTPRKNRSDGNYRYNLQKKMPQFQYKESWLEKQASWMNRSRWEKHKHSDAHRHSCEYSINRTHVHNYANLQRSSVSLNAPKFGRIPNLMQDDRSNDTRHRYSGSPSRDSASYSSSSRHRSRERHRNQNDYRSSNMSNDVDYRQMGAHQHYTRYDNSDRHPSDRQHVNNYPQWDNYQPRNDYQNNYSRDNRQ